MYSKCALSILLLSAAVSADQSSYSSAGNSYAAPAASSGYTSPGGGSGYANTNTGYAAPSQSGYASPQAGYESPSSGYDVGGYDYSYGVEETGDGKDGFALEEIIPLFLVVLAAVLLAGLAGQLLTPLMMLLVGLAPMALNVKAPIINFILAPFNLVLCSTAAGAGTPTVVTGRSLDEWEMDTTYIKLFFDTYDILMRNMQ